MGYFDYFTLNHPNNEQNKLPSVELVSKNTDGKINKWMWKFNYDREN